MAKQLLDSNHRLDKWQRSGKPLYKLPCDVPSAGPRQGSHEEGETMTAEELIGLIKKGPFEQLVAALAPLTETQRKKLSKHVVDLRKELTPKDQNDRPIRDAKAGPLHVDQRVKLALLGVGPWSAVQRLRVWIISPSWHDREVRKHVVQVLSDRKPDWLAQWVDEELEQEHFADWSLVRRLIRAGLCPKPPSENYTLQMLRGIHSFDHQKSLKDRLLDDPELLSDEIWRIFELSPARGTILNTGDITGPARPEYRCVTWSDSLRSLAYEGKLDRQRLLSASLGSLLRNTEARNTAWFAKFHELLEPTDVERQSLQASYVQLLSHPVPSVVGMALDALAVLEKAQKLDALGLLDGISAVFHLQPKGQPLAALKILRRSFARDKSLGPKLAEALSAGLTHPAAQVQERTVEFLSALRDHSAVVISAMLASHFDTLAPSVRDKARPLLAGQGASSPDQAPAGGDTGGDIILQARLAPSPWREQAGIDAVLQALERTGELSAAPFDPMGVPRLDPDERVLPIQSLDELLERLTVAVETASQAVELELLFDGLSRCCDERPPDFQARVAPLVRRVQKLLAPNPDRFVTIQVFGLRARLYKLILRWCEQEAWEPHGSGDTLLGALEARLGVLMVRIRDRQAAPLIACPTHRRGWIDPVEMARRFAWYEDHSFEPSAQDVAQGLLRLAPDGRAQTLVGAGRLRGKFAPAFRYALGGPMEETSLTPAVLIAAGRARAPMADLPDLHSIGESLGPDASMHARYSWKFIPVAEGKTQLGNRLYVNFEPPLPSYGQSRDVPSVLMHTWRAIDGLNRWAATVWPANLQPYFAAGARLRLKKRLLQQRADYLEPLLDPNVPFSEIAQLLLALALNQAEPEVTGLAVDVLIELIRDGRCIGPELGGVLGSMLPWDTIKLNRLGKHLEAVSRASLLHAHVCAQITEAVCAGLTEIPNDLHHLLAPLLEWLTVLERGIRPDLRPTLEKAHTGKIGLLAKRLLKLPSSPGKRDRVLVEALEGRLQRVARWVRSVKPVKMAQ